MQLNKARTSYGLFSKSEAVIYALCGLFDMSGSSYPLHYVEQIKRLTAEQEIDNVWSSVGSSLQEAIDHVEASKQEINETK